MMQLMIKMLQRSQRIYFEIVHLKEKKLITPQRDAAVQDEMRWDEMRGGPR